MNCVLLVFKRKFSTCLGAERNKLNVTTWEEQTTPTKM
jgi:hypothetical protein